jgi:hypothetical protein
MTTSAYRVVLNPGDEHVRYSGRVKMLTKEEANAVREMVKNHVGKTVARFNNGGEEYEILSNCPILFDLDKFFNGVKNNISVPFETYFSEKVKRIALQEKQTAVSQEKQTAVSQEKQTAVSQEKQTAVSQEKQTAVSQEKQTQKCQCSPAMATCDWLYYPPPL